MDAPHPIMQHSLRLANQKAVELLSLGSSVFPGTELVLEHVTASVLRGLDEFAPAARRCLQGCDQTFEMSQKRIAYEESAYPQRENNLHRALNGIIHSNATTVQFLNSTQTAFLDERNMYCVGVTFITDKKPLTFLDISALAWSFLTIQDFAWEPQAEASYVKEQVLT